MNKNLLKSMAVIGTMAAISFSSCKREMSKDEPLPIEFESSIFFASDNRICFSVNLATRETNWEFVADGAVKGSPTIFKNSVILVSTNGSIYKLDKLTGAVMQELNLTVPVLSTPVIYNDKLIVCTTDGRMIAYNGNDLYADPFWTRSGLGQMIGSPTVDKVDDMNPDTEDITAVFIGNAANEVIVVREEDGVVAWRKTMTPSGGIVNALSVSPTNIYAASTNGRIYSMSTLNGTPKWTFTTMGPITAAPVSIGGNVMVGSADMNFYSVDSTTGTLRWKVRVGDKVESTASYDNQFVYFGSNDQHIYGVDIINGIEVWKRRTAGTVKSSPVVLNKQVYVPSYDKNMYILNSETGAVNAIIEVTGQADCSPIIDNINRIYYPPVSGNYFLR